MGCNNNPSGSGPENMGEFGGEDKEEALALNNSEAPIRPENQIERKFIKTGNIEFETENLNKSQEEILEAVKSFNGYLSSENVYKNSYEISSNMAIRVPADNFDKLIREIGIGVEKFDRKEIYVNDVTEEFLDIEARLNTKKELEKKFLEILNKANSVTEILEVEKQIGALRSEIESVEGRLKFLKNQVSYSTLHVRVYEPVSGQTEFGKKFKNGFKNGWNNLILFFVLLVNIWPFILIIIIILIAIRVLRKRKRTEI